MATFLEIQTSVMGTRFAEAQRGDVKTWINAVYWQAWHEERWTFRNATETVTVTANSAAVTGMTADVLRVESLARSNGAGLQYLEPRRFYARYYDATNPPVGPPEAYTNVAGVLSVGPVSNETKTDYWLTYEKAYTKLVNDADVPLLPEGSHEGILVFGATAFGLMTQNDFTWSFFDQKYQASLATLRADYLSDESDDDGSYPADPIGSHTWGGGVY